MDYHRWYSRFTSNYSRSSGSHADLIPSPSSIPSLTNSTSTSRRSWTESDCDIGSPAGDQTSPSGLRAHKPPDLVREAEEELQYAYESQAANLDTSLPARVRNRASGGFFRRFLQRETKASVEIRTTDDVHPEDRDDAPVTPDECVDAAASLATPPDEPTLVAVDNHKELWPAPPLPPPVSSSDFPESPVLGFMDQPMQLVVEKHILPPTILDSSDFASDFEAVFPECKPLPHITASEIPCKAARPRSTQRLSLKTNFNDSSIVPKPYTPLLSPTLPHIPSVLPLFSKKQSQHKQQGSATDKRKPSLSRTLQLFPTPPAVAGNNDTTSTPALRVRNRSKARLSPLPPPPAPVSFPVAHSS